MNLESGIPAASTQLSKEDTVERLIRIVRENPLALIFGLALVGCVSILGVYADPDTAFGGTPDQILAATHGSSATRTEVEKTLRESEEAGVARWLTSQGLPSNPAVIVGRTVTVRGAGIVDSDSYLVVGAHVAVDGQGYGIRLDLACGSTYGLSKAEALYLGPVDPEWQIEFGGKFLKVQDVHVQ